MVLLMLILFTYFPPSPVDGLPALTPTITVTAKPNSPAGAAAGHGRCSGRRRDALQAARTAQQLRTRRLGSLSAEQD